MQDYNYIQHGCFELTLELSCCKYPRPENLSHIWEENKKVWECNSTYVKI